MPVMFRPLPQTPRTVASWAAAPPRTVAQAAVAAAAPSSTINPYPNGVSAPGAGAGVVWQVGFHTRLGVWVADTGFGLAPILRDGQLPGILDLSNRQQWEGSGISSYEIRGYENHRFLSRNDGSGGSPDGVRGLLRHLEILTDSRRDPPGAGGKQRMDFVKDGATGYWVPANVQGLSAKGAFLHGTSLFKEGLAAAVIIAATIATYGATAGWFASAGGAEAAGAGAGAAGTAGAAAGAAVSSGLTAGAIATDVGYASTALSLGQKISGLISGKPTGVMTSAPGIPNTAGVTVPAGTTLLAPDGSLVITTATGQVPSGYAVSSVLPNGQLQGLPGTVLPAIGSGSGGGGGGGFFPPDLTPQAVPSVPQPTTAGVSFIPGVSNQTLLLMLGAAFALAIAVPSTTHRKRKH